MNRLKTVLVSLLLALLFWPVLGDLVAIWLRKEDYSHGFFVIPIGLYFLWERRGRLAVMEKRPSWFGLPLLILALIGYLVGVATRFHTLAYGSMLLVLWGLALFLLGWRVCRELTLPIAFLAFMFPVPSSLYVTITQPLKLFVTGASATLLHGLDVPVYREGNLLLLPSSRLEVVEACSGIRSLYSFTMLGCLFAFLSRAWVGKVLLLLVSFVLALLVNVVRVTVTALLSERFGSEVLEGALHHSFGLVAFALGFAILFLFFRAIERFLGPPFPGVSSGRARVSHGKGPGNASGGSLGAS